MRRETDERLLGRKKITEEIFGQMYVSSEREDIDCDSKDMADTKGQGDKMEEEEQFRIQ